VKRGGGEELQTLLQNLRSQQVLNVKVSVIKIVFGVPKVKSQQKRLPLPDFGRRRSVFRPVLPYYREPIALNEPLQRTSTSR